MNYTKPEVAVLGKATEVIERTGEKPHTPLTDAPFTVISAYDLDE